MGADPLLKVENLTKRFGGVSALEGVSFEVERGALVSLIGPNGAGKTTLFNCLTGVLPPEEGSMLWAPGTERCQAPISLNRLKPHEVVRLGLARTFQNVRLFDNMSVLENVLAGAYARVGSDWWEGIWPWGGRRRAEEDRRALEKAQRLLSQWGLSSSAGLPAAALSYGQRKRLELVRALAAEPALLLLDEPAAGLTFQEKETLMRFLRGLQAQGLTLLLIEHDMRVVMPISTRVIVLDYGAKIAEGPPEAIQEDPKVIEAYLGVQTAP